MAKKTTQFNWWALIGFVLLIEAIGNIGSLATFSQITGWYASLIKPSFNPPNWLFGPAWTLWFALIGASLYLIWLAGRNGKDVKVALQIFWLQMFLNIFWSFIFFGTHSPLYGLVEIILMGLAIIWTIYRFYPISKVAGWLLVPYVLWVSFATVLNYYVWVLNK